MANLQEGLRIPDEVFWSEVERVSEIVGVEARHADYAADAVDRYGLEDRERGLLAVEAAFFESQESEAYWEAYYKLASEVIFGTASQAGEQGWWLRWGANIDAVNKARDWGIGGSSFEALEAGKALGLRAVTFNLAHEEMLLNSGIWLRQLGRYPGTQELPA